MTGPCPCGYVEECAIWCGSGHETGRCAALDGAKIIPVCSNCGPSLVESHPTLMVVRCANCKEWLLA